MSVWRHSMRLGSVLVGGACGWQFAGVVKQWQKVDASRIGKNRLRPQIIFSDLDGTLVHFERHFKDHGHVEDFDAANGTATYVCDQTGGRHPCRVLPTSTMGPGLMSERSCALITELRAHDVEFVYISGARKSTMLERLPILPPADAAIAETGGRIYECGVGTAGEGGLALDTEWQRVIEEFTGPIECTSSSGTGGAEVPPSPQQPSSSAARPPTTAVASLPPANERAGALWDWLRVLEAHGLTADTRSYTCCFRVDLRKQTRQKKKAGKAPGGDSTSASTSKTKGEGSEPMPLAEAEALLASLMATEMATMDVTCAQNLGKYDFFPARSGKGNAVAYMLSKRGVDPRAAVALFDDENDLPMAAEVGHCCVMQCTHGAVADAAARHPEWTVATRHGPAAAEEVLARLLAETMRADLDEMKRQRL